MGRQHRGFVTGAAVRQNAVTPLSGQTASIFGVFLREAVRDHLAHTVQQMIGRQMALRREGRR
ncbi:hypothetical protein D7006_06845 [Xanthobacter sp. YC-JY1]|nr:hypothetical protein D7006_06845 [Xanthobacter sp. YC-JY1]